jgi:hypothetical protein
MPSKSKAIEKAEIQSLERFINDHFVRMKTPARMTNLTVTLQDTDATANYTLTPLGDVDSAVWLEVNEYAESEIEKFLKARGIRLLQD